MVEIIMSYNELNERRNQDTIINQLRNLIRKYNIENYELVNIKIGISKVKEKYD